MQKKYTKYGEIEIPITFSLMEDTFYELEKVCRESRISKKYIIQDAIIAELKKYKGKSEEKI